MRRLLRQMAYLFSASIIPMLALTPAVQGASFNQNNIINDVVFDNTAAMDASEIDAFLNTFPSSCISSNNGFLSIDPTGYNPTTGFSYGGNVTAGRVINDAANAYGINPEVILATLQKEQSLVDGSAGCSTLRYAAATGYGCPDGGTTYNYSGVNLYTLNGTTVTSVNGTCVNTSLKVGFSQQVIRTAWLLKFGEQRSEGNINWAVIKGNWNNSDDPQSCYSGPMTQGTWQVCPSGAITYYDGYITIDGTAVHVDTGGTAALYWYTPHFAGNQNFFAIFNSWFGSPYVSNQPYAWNVASQQAFVNSDYTQPFAGTITLTPGQKAYLEVSARNFGYQTWNQSVVHLGTSYIRDRSSAFADTSWLASNRIAMQETSVLPGDTATFKFSATAPSAPGTYVEHFDVVADGTAWLRDTGLYYAIDVVAAAQPTNNQETGLTSGQSIQIGQRLYSPDMQSTLSLSTAGDLTLRRGFVSVWSNNIADATAQSLVLQNDGNLVEYSTTGRALWASGTLGANNTLALQTDGNLVLYSQSGNALWASSTGIYPDYLHRANESLPSTGVLFPGQYLQTADRTYTLIMQNDGNLVEYDNSTGNALWASHTVGGGNTAVMQSDGNLVIYSWSGKAMWASGTSGNGNYLTLQPDGVLSLYNQQTGFLWSGRILHPGQYLQTADRTYTLIMQNDGNLVEYDNSTGNALWASHTVGGGNTAVMQSDGNLVIYSWSGKAMWASGTSGNGVTISLQHDGNMVIYQSGKPLWANGA